MDLPDCVKFQLGQTVYHKSQPESPGIVCEIIFCPGAIMYYVQWTPGQSNRHYEFELNSEKAL